MPSTPNHCKRRCKPLMLIFFFFNDTATTEIYTLSLHDALPISFSRSLCRGEPAARTSLVDIERDAVPRLGGPRSEEHTSELQSRQYLVCRLLLEKKKVRVQPNQQRL